jgi:hypothetical protein
MALDHHAAEVAAPSPAASAAASMALSRICRVFCCSKDEKKREKKKGKTETSLPSLPNRALAKGPPFLRSHGDDRAGEAPRRGVRVGRG